MNIETLKYALHCPGYGWIAAQDGGFAGTQKMSLATNSFQLKGLDFRTEYRVRSSSAGWQETWTPQGLATPPVPKITAIQIRFPQGLPPDVLFLGTSYLEDDGFCGLSHYEPGSLMIGTGKAEDRRLEGVQFGARKWIQT